MTSKVPVPCEVWRLTLTFLLHCPSAPSSRLAPPSGPSLGGVVRAEQGGVNQRQQEPLSGGPGWRGLRQPLYRLLRDPDWDAPAYLSRRSSGGRGQAQAPAAPAQAPLLEFLRVGMSVAFWESESR